MKRFFLAGKSRILFWTGLLLGMVLIIAGNNGIKWTSTDAFCASCHVHPHSTESWKRSTHVDNKRGIQVHCVECHLPPKGEGYLGAKISTGMRDVWGTLFKDPESLNWEEKSRVEHAQTHVYNSSCIKCHSNFYPMGLSVEGMEAHLYYEDNANELHCINCHIAVGHYAEGVIHAKNMDFGKDPGISKDVFAEAAVIEEFTDFTEYIPGTRVKFDMIAIPGGKFLMGSPPDESLRAVDEGPQREVELSAFYMGKYEVSWDEYLAFFSATASQGKTADAYLNSRDDVDGISGPTPPWGAPDQGWGKASSPAITMSHHAAEVYCQWLSEVCGKTYRLPTEAEWEYAARAGTKGPYFFEGDPARFSGEGLIRKLFGADTSRIASHSVYIENSPGRPLPPGSTRANPFGLVNMLGNVAEMCADWYSPSAYADYPGGLLRDPLGPAQGEEHVVRGGSYRDEADRLRCAARDYTRSDLWLRTDPQIPKSIWWYSDCTTVGFRVVCEAK